MAGKISFSLKKVLASIQFYYWLIIGLVFVFTYGRWFLPGDLTWGDWQTWFAQGLADWRQFNIWWDQTHAFGQSIFDIGSAIWAPFFWLSGQLNQIFNLPFSVISKLIWFGPFVLFSLISLPIFWRVFFPRDQHGWFWAMLLYSFNPYILLLTMGGHISVAIVYALTPLLIALTQKSIQEKSLFWPLLSAILWIVASYYEIRIVTLVILLTIIIILWQINRRKFWRFIGLIFYYGLALALAHFWWLVPFLRQSDKVGVPLENLRVDRSYLDFLHTLLLYHSQWPDNVLGKINPIAPIFVLIPIVIILTIWQSWQKKYYFGIVTLLTIFYLGGAFLAKGTQLPLGDVYRLLFDNVPFFKLFRDASKFLLIVAFSASLLWGLFFELWQKNARLSKTALGGFLMMAFLFFGLWLPATNSSFRGTFLRKELPKDYQFLKKKISAHDQFDRTIWLPRYSRFSYFSSTHPRSGLIDLTYHEWKDLVPKPGEADSFFRNPISQFLFNSASVRYLAIPYDSGNDIYKDYQPKDSYRALADQVPWLKKIADSKIILYENQNFRPKITAGANLIALSGPNLMKKVFASQKDWNDLNLIFANQKQTRRERPPITAAWAGISNVRLQKNNRLTADLNINEAGIYRLADNSTRPIKINGRNYDHLKGINLSIGKHQILIEDDRFFGQKLNLLTDRTHIAPCTHTSDTSQFNQVKINASGPISLSSNGQLSCLALKIDNIQENQSYQLALDSQISGENPDARWEIYTESGDYQSLNVTRDNAAQMIQFKTVKKTNFAALSFRLNGAKTNWQLDQVDLIGPINFAALRDAYLFQKIDSAPVLSTAIDFRVQQLSSSHYQIKFKNIAHNYYLTLGTNFHPDWQATINHKPIKDHFLINGWANGWYIKDKGNFIIDLQFKPELIFQKTKWVSLGWMVLLISLTIFSLLKIKNTNNQTITKSE